MLVKVESTLESKGIRPTAMRLLVPDYLLKQTAAVSLNDLETCFHRSDRVTLCRTLKTFEAKGRSIKLKTAVMQHHGNER